jgi:hypothetical protein
MAKENQPDEIFDLVDIREIPDDQLDDLMGSGSGVPNVKAV